MTKRRNTFGFSFSLSRALGISGIKNKVSRKIGVPLTKSGRQKKYGGWLEKLLFGWIK